MGWVAVYMDKFRKTGLVYERKGNDEESDDSADSERSSFSDASGSVRPTTSCDQGDFEALMCEVHGGSKERSRSRRKSLMNFGSVVQSLRNSDDSGNAASKISMSFLGKFR